MTQLSIDPFSPTAANWSRPFEGAPIQKYMAWYKYATQHREHGKRLERRALEAIRKVYDQPGAKISFKHLFEVLRWEDIELKKKPEDQFKLTNTWHSYFSRAFIRKYPQLSRFIDVKPLKQEEHREAA